MISKRPKTKPAVSLVEVLVVLGVVSMTLVGSLSLVATSYSQVKNTEIEDAVNGLMIQALEAIKSPTNVTITSSTLTASATGSVHYFSLLNKDPSATSLKEETDTSFSECKASSPFYYTLTYNPSGEGQSNTVNLCLQVVIIPRQTTENSTYYEATVNARYQLGKESKTNSLKTYRYGAFNSK